MMMMTANCRLSELSSRRSKSLQLLNCVCVRELAPLSHLCIIVSTVCAAAELQQPNQELCQSCGQHSRHSKSLHPPTDPLTPPVTPPNTVPSSDLSRTAQHQDRVGRHGDLDH